MVSILSKWTVTNVILASGWVGRTIIVILFIMSVISLAIFIKKIKEFKRIEAQNRAFLRYFRAKTSLEEFCGITARLNGPLLRVFNEAYGEVKKSEANPGILPAKLISNISSSTERTKLRESQSFENRLIFIATTATISPFLGLLGTVWGIMIAFMDIRTYGSAHINIVAPGIAEALITTVAGLCVAIPAVVFYNYLTNRASKLGDQLDVFSNELVEELRAKISE